MTANNGTTTTAATTSSTTTAVVTTSSTTEVTTEGSPPSVSTPPANQLGGIAPGQPAEAVPTVVAGDVLSETKAVGTPKAPGAPKVAAKVKGNIGELPFTP